VLNNLLDGLLELISIDQSHERFIELSFIEKGLDHIKNSF